MLVFSLVLCLYLFPNAHSNNHSHQILITEFARLGTKFLTKVPGKKTSQIHSVNFEIKQTSLISAQYLCHIVLGGIILLGEGSVDGGEWSKASGTGNTLFNNSYKI